MLDTIKSQWSARIAIGLFLFFTAWWVILQFLHLPHESDKNQLWAAVYGVVALWGGIWSLIASRKWGGLKSIVGKSIFFFALGLLAQEIGQVAYSYYIYFLHEPIPYPSLGDYFFWSTVIFYIIGVIYLAQASGVHITLKSITGRLQLILIPAVILLLCYIVFLQGYKIDASSPIKTVIDLGVPIGEAIYTSMALLAYTLTKSTLGGIMKYKVLFVLVALIAEFIADWTFLYQANREIWYAGGINDYMYLVAYFLMSLALINIGAVVTKLRQV